MKAKKMKIRLWAGIAAATAAIGGLGGLGMAGAASASPASASVAHCNVIMVGGYSPCFPRPIGPINPGGPVKPLPLAAS
jgi:hypothetical protein